MANDWHVYSVGPAGQGNRHVHKYKHWKSHSRCLCLWLVAAGLRKHTCMLPCKLALARNSTHVDQNTPVRVLTAHSDGSCLSPSVPVVSTIFLQLSFCKVEHCVMPIDVETYTSEPWPGTATTSYGLVSTRGPTGPPPPGKNVYQRSQEFGTAGLHLMCERDSRQA